MVCLCSYMFVYAQRRRIGNICFCFEEFIIIITRFQFEKSYTNICVFGVLCVLCVSERVCDCLRLLARERVVTGIPLWHSSLRTNMEQWKQLQSNQKIELLYHNRLTSIGTKLRVQCGCGNPGYRSLRHMPSRIHFVIRKNNNEITQKYCFS